MKEIYVCTCIYKFVNLLEPHDSIHGMTNITKIMLSGIAIIKTGYFDNINGYYLKYHIVSRTKTRDKPTTTAKSELIP